MVRKQSAPVQRQVISAPVQRPKLPDKITCGICRKVFNSRSVCTEHMKMHSRARTAIITSSSSSYSGSNVSGSHLSGQRPRTAVVDRPKTGFTKGNGTDKPMLPKRAVSAPFTGRQNPSSQRPGGSAKKSFSQEDGRVYVCFYCQAPFPSMLSLSRHSRTHGGATPYSCTQCGRMFALYSSLMTHEKSHMPDHPPACRCHRCGAVFLHDSSLKAHLRRHDSVNQGPEDRPYQCVICQEWISNEGSLRIHMQRHETLDSARICSLCGTSFSSDAILRAHVKLHDAESVTRCVICIRPFRRSRVLLRHSDVHADDRQNVCDSCEKRFPKVAEGSWRRMQLLAPEDRQFQCLYCGVKFNRLYQLAAHESGHTDLPPSAGNGQLHPPVVVVN